MVPAQPPKYRIDEKTIDLHSRRRGHAGREFPCGLREDDEENWIPRNKILLLRVGR
jgi:hypothetical protein